jgi:1-acyl-sn-glycerol-3-phosphate acyltransferase
VTQLLRVLLTVVAGILVAIDTIVMGSFGVLVGPIPPKGDWTRKGARLWARVICWVAMMSLRVEGAEQVPLPGPVVFMSNHESWLDIPVLLATIPGQVRFLAKKSLFSVPFLGWAMTAMGFIPVDRENRRTAIASFDAAADRLRSGRSVLIFPEETRTLDGNLLPFQRGGFLIAIKAGIPIVPVGLEGPRRCLAKKSYLLRPGAVTARFGAPIPTAGLGVTAKSALMEQVRISMEALRGNTGATVTVVTTEGHKEA